MRIVFMGTPDFATGILQAIVEEGKHEVCAVVTSVDKAAGRGMKIQKSSVKCYAEEQGLPILQPEKLRDEQFICQLQALQADIYVVVAFRMLPQVVWSIPPKGTINLHASLLPHYRGAAPINWAIINGETSTGVTTFFINERIDEGKIILKKGVDILSGDTAGILHDKLIYAGRQAMLETLQSIANGICKPVPQNEEEVQGRLAPKIYKDDCVINWQQPAVQVYNFVRGLSPYPAAYTYYMNDKGEKIMMKIYGGHIEENLLSEPAGIMHSDDKNYLYITCKEGCFFADEVQITGKKRLNIHEFLLGNKGFEGKKTC